MGVLDEEGEQLKQMQKENLHATNADLFLLHVLLHVLLLQFLYSCIHYFGDTPLSKEPFLVVKT